MLKYLWNKNRVLMKIASFIIVAVLIMGTLLIIDSIKKAVNIINENLSKY